MYRITYHIVLNPDMTFTESYEGRLDAWCGRFPPKYTCANNVRNIYNRLRREKGLPRFDPTTNLLLSSVRGLHFNVTSVWAGEFTLCAVTSVLQTTPETQTLRASQIGRPAYCFELNLVARQFFTDPYFYLLLINTFLSASSEVERASVLDRKSELSFLTYYDNVKHNQPYTYVYLNTPNGHEVAVNTKNLNEQRFINIKFWTRSGSDCFNVNEEAWKAGCITAHDVIIHN